VYRPRLQFASELAEILRALVDPVPPSFLAACGLLGVVTGISLFLLTVSDEKFGWQWFIVLFVTAIVSLYFDDLRNVIDGRREKQSGSHIAFSILMLLFFELLVTATHSAIENDRGRALIRIASSVVNGRVIAGHSRTEFNLIAMIGLWIVIGAATAFVLAIQVRVEDRQIPGALLGALAGSVVAPILLFVYIVAVRLLLELEWMATDPDGWTRYLQYHYSLLSWKPQDILEKVPLWFLVTLNSHFHGHGALVAVGATVVMLLLLREMDYPCLLVLGFGFFLMIVYGAPVLVAFVEDFRTLVKLQLLVIMEWSIPAILLGTAFRYLRREPANPRAWTAITILAAIILTIQGFRSGNEWFLVGAGGLLFSSLLALRSERFRAQQWPVIALSVAITIAAITGFTLSNGFFQAHDLSWVLINDPVDSIKSAADVQQSLEDVASYRTYFAKEVSSGDFVYLTPENFHSRSVNIIYLMLTDKDRVVSTPTGTGLGMDGLQEALKEEVIVQHHLYHANVLLLQAISADNPPRLPNSIEGVLALSQIDARGMITVKNTERLPSGFQSSVLKIASTRDDLFSSAAVLRATIENEKATLARSSQVCMTGALGFWISLAAFATWSLRTQRAGESDKRPSN
jgi:hypothetical protein